jgi:hypothetical protein
MRTEDGTVITAKVAQIVAVFAVNATTILYILADVITRGIRFDKTCYVHKLPNRSHTTVNIGIRSDNPTFVGCKVETFTHCHGKQPFRR